MSCQRYGPFIPGVPHCVDMPCQPFGIQIRYDLKKVYGEDPPKNWMLPRYAGVPRTLWREKGRTFPSANAPKGLDYSGSLDEGQVVCKVLNMFRALFYFTRRRAHQKMSYLFLSLCWTHTTERSQGPKCFRTLWQLWCPYIMLWIWTECVLLTITPGSHMNTNQDILHVIQLIQQFYFLIYMHHLFQDQSRPQEYINSSQLCAAAFMHQEPESLLLDCVTFRVSQSQSQSPLLG